MTTWLDRLRGEGQGRTKPKGFTAPDGEHVFILGADAQIEPAILSPGDATEIKQLVDLTNWDLVAATMNTVGVVMGQSQEPTGFLEDPDTLWWFNYDIAVPHVPNRVPGAFAIDGQGDLEYGLETYSPVPTTCRVIPVGAGAASLAGANTPQFFPGPSLPQYTIQFWMNFDSDAFATSWGVSPSIFHCQDGIPNGVAVGLSGAFGPGAHSWRFAVSHWFGGAQSVIFVSPVIDTPSFGWHLVSIVWDSFLAPADRLRLYIDDDPTIHVPAVAMGTAPSAPAPGTNITVASPLLWGGIDEMRMLSRALSQPEVADSYLATTVLPPPADHEWLMQILVNAEVYGERVVRPGERRRWTDFKVPVRHLSGICEVGFRLQLREV